MLDKNNIFIQSQNLQTQSIPTQAITGARQEFMSRVYAWMVSGLLITGFVAWWVFDSGLWMLIASNSIILIGLVISELVLVYQISARIESISRTTASGAFILYAILNGLVLSSILVVYTAESIQQVFFIAASMFAALSVYGWVTKRDLSGIRSFMIMGLIGIIMVGIFNVFVQSSALSFGISVLGVFIFSGLTVYDTQKLKDLWIDQSENNEMASKGAILGALMLYLDFVNLFLFLLRLLGRRD